MAVRSRRSSSRKRSDHGPLEVRRSGGNQHAAHPGLDRRSRRPPANPPLERVDTILSDVSPVQPGNPGIGADLVRRLQRDYGNRSVQRLVDHMATRHDGKPRKAPIQPKPTVDPAGTSGSDAQRQPMEEEEELMQLSPLPEQAQRQPMEEEEEMLQPKRLGIQRQAGLVGGGRAESLKVQRKGLSKLLPWNWFKSRKEATPEVEQEEGLAEAGPEVFPEFTASTQMPKNPKMLAKGTSGYVYKGEQEGKDVAAKLPLEFESEREGAGRGETDGEAAEDEEPHRVHRSRQAQSRTCAGHGTRRGRHLRRSCGEDRGSEATVHEKRKALRRLFKGALKGLAALQKGNLIDGDIKGANILVGADGESKIADIGDAKVGTGEFGVGTEGYPVRPSEGRRALEGGPRPRPTCGPWVRPSRRRVGTSSTTIPSLPGPAERPPRTESRRNGCTPSKRRSTRSSTEEKGSSSNNPSQRSSKGTA